MEKVVVRNTQEISKLQKDLEDRNRLLEDIIGNTPDDKKGEFVKALEVSFGLWRKDVEGKEQALRKREQELRKRELKAEEPKPDTKEVPGMDVTKMLKILGETEHEKRKRKTAESLAEKMQMKATRLERERDSLKAEVMKQKQHCEEPKNRKDIQQMARELQSSKAAQAAASRKADEDKAKLELETAKLRKAKDETAKALNDLRAKIANLEQQNTILGNSLLGTGDKDAGQLRKRVMQLEGENAELKHRMEDLERQAKTRGLIVTKKSELIGKLEEATGRKDQLI
eukprot:gene8712-11223_t